MTNWRSIEEPDDPVIVLRGLPATTPACYERFYRRRQVVTLGSLATLFQRLISWSIAVSAHLLLAAAFLGLYLRVTQEEESLITAGLYRGNAGEEGKKLETPEFEPAKEEKKDPEPPKPEPPKPEPVPEPPKPAAPEKAPEKENPAPSPVPEAAPKPASIGAGASASGRPSAPVNDAEVEKDPTAALRARRAGELDQLRKGSDKDIVVVRGQYDTVELVLARLGIPHRVVDPERLPAVDLSGTKILLLNCHNLYGSYLFKEADTKGLEKLIDQLDAKSKDLDRRLAATKEPRTVFRLRLEHEQTTSYLGECRRRLEGLSYSGEVADVVGRFVRNGGYVFTSDWGLSILERALPGYVKNGGNVGPKTVSIRPRSGKERHAILEDVFYETTRASTTSLRKFLWEIDSASYLVKVEKPDAVETLVESAELPRCPAVAVLITPEAEAGSRPGRVLHILSHFQKQATQQGDFALQSMLLNFMLDRVRPAERRAARLPEPAGPAAAPAAPPRAEFTGVHRDQKGRFTLAVPKGWTLTTTGDAANPVVLEKPGDGLRGSLSVSAPPSRVDRSFDWDPYVRALVEGLERQCDEVKVTRKMQAFSDGHPAYFVSMLFKKGEARWGVLQYAVVTPQATFTLAWTAPADSFRELEPVFEQACRAFHATPRD